MMRAIASTVRWAVPGLALALLVGCAGVQERPLEAPAPDQIPELEAELERRPGDAELMVRLGAAYREAGQLERARSVLQEAHRVGDGPGSAAFYLGLTYEDLEQFGQAREVYRGYLDREGSSRLDDAIRKRIDYLHRRELEAAARDAVSRESELADRVPQEGTVAVFPFVYRGQDEELQPLTRALAAFLVTDLGQVDRVTVLERMRVQLLLDEMKLGESQYVDPSTAARSGRLLGAANIVQGQMDGDEEELSVQASLMNAAGGVDGGLEHLLDDRGSAEQIFEVENRIALGVFRSLGVELTPAERRRLAEHPTENLQAFLAFGRGLIAADSADFTTAATHFQRAADLDPGFQQAQERAQEASNVSEAANTDTDQLAQDATEEPAGTDARETLENEPIVPTTSERDPVAEATGTEGASSSVLIRIRIPTPGGGGG